MKRILTVIALVLIAGPVIIDPVFAASQPKKDILCASTNVADGGYTFHLAANGKAGVLKEQSIMGPRKLADMDCEALHGEPNVPDMIHNYAACRDARAPQSGLVVRMYRGGFAGFHYASVRELTEINGQAIEKEVEFGRLSCTQG